LHLLWETKILFPVWQQSRSTWNLEKGISSSAPGLHPLSSHGRPSTRGSTDDPLDGSSKHWRATRQ